MGDTAFKPGDTVRLKSGGPVMTVMAVEGAEVITVWFEKTNKKVDKFNPVTLVHDDGVPVIA